MNPMNQTQQPQPPHFFAAMGCSASRPGADATVGPEPGSLRDSLTTHRTGWVMLIADTTDASEMQCMYVYVYVYAHVYV